MALISLGKSRCPPCDAIIAHGDDDDIVATRHFITDRADPLWPYSDAAMHRPCFLAWPPRRRFVARYGEIMGAITWGNGTYHHMQPVGTILSQRRGEA